MNDKKSFEGKTAIVTGSARGFGRAIATKLARDGAAVTLVDLRKELVDEAVRKLRDEGGKIVNISSSAGRSMSTFCGADYTASKAAVLGLTRHAANENAPYNININAIAPGTFITEGAKEGLGDLPEEFLEQEAQKIPMRRFGTPEDLANLVAFLCSEQASYITGATIDINGGDLMM